MALGWVMAFMLLAPSADARKKREELPPATTGLIDNVNGIAIGKDGFIERFTGLLIDKDGRVERRLSRDDKRPERLSYRHDAQGKTLIPSFIEGHNHVIDTGIALMTLDLSETRSLAEAQAKIAAYAQANPGRRWILGRGWDAARWGTPDRMPTPADLDAAVADTPAWLLSSDGKTGWANSATLRLAKMKATATLSGTAKEQMERVVPAPAPKDRDIALDKAQRFYIERGISTVTDMGTDILDWQAFRRAALRDRADRRPAWRSCSGWRSRSSSSCDFASRRWTRRRRDPPASRRTCARPWPSVLQRRGERAPPARDSRPDSG